MSAQIREVSKNSGTPKGLVHKTRNNLDEKTRKASVEVLNARLAAGIDLALAIKQAHWNLRGPNFIGVHELLDVIRAEVDTGNDLIAERASQLGGYPLGTTQTVAEATSLKPYPTNIVTVEDHLEALIERLGDVANDVRESIDTTDKAGDADTADILTEVSRDLDKNLWFLESHVIVK